jgi:hypothetical protein
MHRRPWEAYTNAKLVRQGLQGQPVAAICPEYQRRQSRDDPWRDQGRAPASQPWERHPHTRNETRLARAHARRKTRVGAWLLECNNSDEGLG